MTTRRDELAFRAGIPGDAPQIAPLVYAGFESYRPFAVPGWEPPALEGERDRIAATLARPSVWCELAHDGDRLVGHVGWFPAAESRIPSDEPGLLHFWQLFVARDWWGSGLATRLHADAVTAAAERGYAALRLWTPADHGRGRRFYEREGWALSRERFEDPAFGMDCVEYRREPGPRPRGGDRPVAPVI
jgi:GNAT superfamily N-acetyltransferase